jgi:hypothetical protein
MSIQPAEFRCGNREPHRPHDETWANHENPLAGWTRCPGIKPVWNVAAYVVDLVEAWDESEAIGKLTTALKAAGFDIYEGDPPNAFESEPGVKASR